MKKPIMFCLLLTAGNVAVAQTPVPAAWQSVEVTSVQAAQVYVGGRSYMLASKVRMNGVEMSGRRAAEILSFGGNIMIIRRNDNVITELSNDMR